ncbi:MAG: cysteine hydrolase [Anaerolineales bacterium]|nr:MAG: cysteine hydrolase [Anaerolineales bacterium]
MSNVVIVVDMQRGFLEEGNSLFCGDKARQIIPNVQKLLAEEVTKGSTLLFTADTHDPDDKEFQMFQPHCVRGTPEVEIVPELSEFVEKGTVIPKTRYSGFFGTDMEQRLAELAPEKLIVCGVCTDICVMHTVADARNRDYTVEVPRDCVASFDPEAHEFALKHMEKVLGAKVV